MRRTAKQAFAARLIEALIDAGQHSARNAESGVAVGPLAKIAGVSREMARRYTRGIALPHPDKMRPIADWLKVRVAWLRDGEGGKAIGPTQHATLRDPGGAEYLSAEAIEIAKVWLKLAPERRECFRDLMCLEAVVSSHYPWLMFGRPRAESYTDYEHRVEGDMARIAAKLIKHPVS